MKALAIMLALVCACDDEEADTDAVKATKAQCHEVLKHIVAISPQGQGQEAEAIAAALPIEDIQSCVASEPEIRACMLTALDVPAVRKCIPKQDVLDCMQKAAKAKRADIRAKCWAGDAKAADGLKF